MKSFLHKFFLLASAFVLLQISHTKGQVVTTIVKGLMNPTSILVGKLDTLYVFSEIDHTMRKIDPLGGVSIFVGTGGSGGTDGIGTAASFGNIINMIMDTAGNIYACDYTYGAIRKITPAGVVTTLMYTGKSNRTVGITLGKADTIIIVNHLSGEMEKINTTNGTISYFTKVPIYCFGLAKGEKDTIYIGGYGTQKIYKVDPLGNYTTFAGAGGSGYVDGVGTIARFRGPSNIVLDGLGNLFVTDVLDNRIRKVTPDGVVTTFAGSGDTAEIDGTGTSAAFDRPYCIVMSPKTGNFYVIDNIVSGSIRKITGGVPLKVENTMATNASPLTVFPSPFKDAFTIVSPNQQNLQLINMQGQIVQQIALKAGRQNIIVAQLPSGIYYLQSEDGAVQKLIKE